MTENIALVKKHQSKFARKANKLKKELETSTSSVKEEQIKKVSAGKQKYLQRGIIYVGHIPHGFYEEQMRSYFKQFGKVRNVVVCRSKKTDKSKGFGFVQFDDQDVAKVAAETMNNYLMFKRKLIAKYIPPEEVKADMLKPAFWKSDAHKKFIEAREKVIRKKNSNNVDNEKLVNIQIGRLNKKQKLLADLGIDYNIPVVNNIPAQKNANLLKAKDKEDRKILQKKMVTKNKNVSSNKTKAVKTNKK